jgi:uncharacterized membrane protein
LPPSADNTIDFDSQEGGNGGLPPPPDQPVDSEGLEPSVASSVSPGIVPSAGPNATPSASPSTAASMSSQNEFPSSQPTLRTRTIVGSEAEEGDRTGDSWKADAMIWLFVVLPLAVGAFLFLIAYACRRGLLPPIRQQLPGEV